MHLKNQIGMCRQAGCNSNWKFDLWTHALGQSCGSHSNLCFCTKHMQSIDWIGLVNYVQYSPWTLRIGREKIVQFGSNTCRAEKKTQHVVRHRIINHQAVEQNWIIKLCMADGSIRTIMFLPEWPYYSTSAFPRFGVRWLNVVVCVYCATVTLALVSCTRLQQQHYIHESFPLVYKQTKLFKKQ